MYTITNRDGSIEWEINENAPDNTVCSVSLFGRRQTDYGSLMAENLVHMLENFAHTTAPANPLKGQFWFDKTDDTLRIFNGSIWSTIITVSENGGLIKGNQLVATTTTLPPLVVSSTSKVNNLNADLLDGYHAHLTNANSVPVRDTSGDIFANFFRGTATASLYGDLAERFEASEPLEVGDVVTLGGEKEIALAVDSDFVLGIISGEPGVRMNEGAGDDTTHPFVAYKGRVPVKVVGKISKFAPLYLSEVPGHLEARKRYATQPIIARALAAKEDTGTGTVMVVYGVK